MGLTSKLSLIMIASNSVNTAQIDNEQGIIEEGLLSTHTTVFEQNEQETREIRELLSEMVDAIEDDYYDYLASTIDDEEPDLDQQDVDAHMDLEYQMNETNQDENIPNIQFGPEIDLSLEGIEEYEAIDGETDISYNFHAMDMYYDTNNNWVDRLGCLGHGLRDFRWVDQTWQTLHQRRDMVGMMIRQMAGVYTNTENLPPQALMAFRTWLRSYNEIANRWNDQYVTLENGPAGIERIPPQDDTIAQLFENNFGIEIECQSGEYFGGALENQKKMNKNKYARNQYRKKKKIQKEEQKVQAALDEYVRQRDKKEHLKEIALQRLHKEKNRKALLDVETYGIGFLKKTIPDRRLKQQHEDVMRELQNVVLYRRELQELKKHNKKCHNSMNTGARGKVKTDEVSEKRRKDREHSMNMISAERAVRYLELVEMLPKPLEDCEYQTHSTDSSISRYLAEYYFFDRVERFYDRHMAPKPYEQEPDKPEAKFDVTHMVEKVVLFLMSLKMSDNIPQMLCATVSFISNNTDGGITGKISQLLEQVFARETEHQSGLLDGYKTVKDAWTKIRNSTFIGRVVSLLTIAIPCMMSSMFGFKVKNFDFHKYMGLSKGKLKTDAESSIIEMVMDNIIFFVDKGLSYFTGGITNLLYDDDRMTKYDKEYSDLVAAYPNVENNTMFEATGDTMAKYLVRLNTNVKECDKMIGHIPKHGDRRFLVDRQVRMKRMIDETTKKIQGQGTRIKPFTIMLEGPSGGGKTNLKTMICRQVQLSNPGYFVDDPSATVTVNGDDQFDTEVDNSHDTIVYDDAGNTMPQFAKGNICQKIINISNNEPKAVLKADVDSKGKVWYAANMLMVTSNVEHLHARQYSVDSGSILRRFNLIAKVSVKKEYAQLGGVSLDEEKVDSLFTDIWEFRLYKHIPTENKESREEEFVLNGEPMRTSSFQEFMELVTKLSKMHFHKQEQLLIDQRSVKTMTLCEHGYLSKMCTHCPKTEDQIGFGTVAYVVGLSLFGRDLVKRECLKTAKWALGLSPLMTYFFGFAFFTYPLLLCFAIGVTARNIRCAWHVRKYNHLFKMSVYADKHKFDFLAGAVAMTSFLLAIKAIKSFRKGLKVCSSLEYQGAAYGVPEGHEEPIKSCFTIEKTPPEDLDPKLKSMTVDQGVAIVSSKLCYAEFHFENSVGYNDILPLKTNVWLLNWHVLGKHPKSISVYIGEGSPVGPSFSCSLNPLLYRRIPGTDLGVVYLPKGGSQKDIMHMFGTEIPQKGGKGRLIYKQKDGKVTQESIRYDPVEAPSDDGNTSVIMYKPRDPCFTGMCMSTMVSEGISPKIVSLHSQGGITDKHLGIGQCVTRRQIEECIESLINSSPSFFMNVMSEAVRKEHFPEHGIFQTGNVHPKSAVSWLQEGQIKVYGDLNGPGAKYQSKVVKTNIADTVEDECKWPIQFGAPKKISSWEPKYAELEKISHTAEIPWDDFEYAYKDYRDKVFTGLCSKPYIRGKLKKLANIHVLSGIDGLRGIDSVNFATSAGFPINRSKNTFATRTDVPREGVTNPVEIPQEMWDEVDEMERKLLRGERIYPVATAHLKDEPKKLDSEKVRVMYGTPFTFLLLMRRHLLTFSKVYMDNPEIFETTVGMNVFGPEWHRLGETIQSYSPDKIVAGDIPSCDSRMGSQTILAEGRLFRDIKQWSGNFDDEDLTIHDGIFTELAYPTINFFKTMIEANGCNTSGHTMTIILNDVYVSFLNRATHHHIWKNTRTGKVPRFSDLVKLRTNGDDNLSSVHPDYKEYNHTSMKKYMDEIGVGYTMPRKDEESKPYQRLDEVDYLKRAFRYSEEMQRYHPALEMGSIFKMLQVGIPSKEMTRDEQDACNINTALQELYYHGPKVFHERREQLMRVAEKHDLEAWTQKGKFVTYEDCEKFDVEQYYGGSQLPSDFEHQSGTRPIQRIISGVIRNKNTKWHGCIGYQPNTFPQECVRLGLQSFGNSPRGVPLFRGVLPHTICVYLCESDPTHASERKWVTTPANENSGAVTNVTNMSNDIDQHQTMVFRDGTDQWVSSIPNMFDRTRDAGITDDVPLDKFFERPINVVNLQWDPAVATKYFYSFNPWSLYFSDKRVINRIDNYHLLRCKLKVKFNITGNGFYYGRAMAEAALSPGQDSVSLLSTGVTNAPLVQASQRIHGYLNPTESQGCILCIPYISQANNMVIPNGDWTKQCNVYIREMNRLKHSNGSVNPVTISVFIWAEDVRLSIPTSVSAFGLVPQSGELSKEEVEWITRDEKGKEKKVAGFTEEEMTQSRRNTIFSVPKKKEKDVKVVLDDELEFQSGEYKAGGNVSSMMSSIAGVARGFTSLPLIAPYAKATQMVATGAGSMAKLFGYARPKMLSDPVYVKRALIGTMAATDQPDTCLKLSVDSKQELTVDPRTFGVENVDEMDISYIAGIESYLDTFPWTVAARPNNQLFSIAVTPRVYQVSGGYYFLPACAFASMPFTYWRGSMIYRFQIVGSTFHRGRLLFTYSPGGGASPETHTQYTRIIDLSNERDFTIEVGWAAESSMLQVADPGASTSYVIGAAGVPVAPFAFNGSLTCYVLNDLTSPSDTVNNDIGVNVFVKAGKDISYSVPNERFQTWTYNNTVAPQMGQLEYQSGEMEMMDSDNAPVVEEVKECVAPCLDVDNTYDVFMGEQIFSFRQLLKRYMYHTSYYSPTQTPSSVNIREVDFPVYRGVDSVSGRHTNQTVGGGVAPNVNNVKTTLLNYLAPAFVGYRGSLRAKYVAQSQVATNGGRMIVARSNGFGPFTQSFIAASVTNTAAFAAANDNLPSLFTGGEVSDLTVSPVLEVELPFYSNKRYENTRVTNGSSDYQSHVHRVLWSANTGANSYMDRYVSVGEDFQLFLFQGCPPIFTGQVFYPPP